MQHSTTRIPSIGTDPRHRKNCVRVNTVHLERTRALRNTRRVRRSTQRCTPHVTGTWMELFQSSVCWKEHVRKGCRVWLSWTRTNFSRFASHRPRALGLQRCLLCFMLFTLDALVFDFVGRVPLCALATQKEQATKLRHLKQNTRSTREAFQVVSSCETGLQSSKTEKVWDVCVRLAWG